MTTNPESSAFPYLYGEEIASEEGLTKRELFAAMAMQGILANPANDYVKRNDLDEGVGVITFDAVTCADALVERLNEKESFRE